MMVTHNLAQPTSQTSKYRRSPQEPVLRITNKKILTWLLIRDKDVILKEEALITQPKCISVELNGFEISLLILLKFTMLLIFSASTCIAPIFS